jgi:hypothetical protein
MTSKLWAVATVVAICLAAIGIVIVSQPRTQEVLTTFQGEYNGFDYFNATGDVKKIVNIDDDTVVLNYDGDLDGVLQRGVVYKYYINEDNYLMKWEVIA